MIIAFEGPDNVGKSTVAKTLGHLDAVHYNMTDVSYRDALQDEQQEPDLVTTFDRIDWLTHMVYRLGMPGYEWNDARIRTVFAAPQAHLVVMQHHPDNFLKAEDSVNNGEVYLKDSIQYVNSMYGSLISSLIDINENTDFSLYKSITTLEVSRVGGYTFRCMDFSSPVHRLTNKYKDTITTPTHLMGLLYREEQHQLKV